MRPPHAPLAVTASGPAGGPALLLVHGFLGSRRDWEPVAARLEAQARCLAIDLPGHGATADPGESTLWSVEGCADALAGLLAETPAPRRFVAGYSLGGRVALHLAARHPGIVDGAVVLSGSPGLADPAERARRREEDEALARSLDSGDLEGFLDAWYRAAIFEPLRAHARFAAVLARRRENAPALLARSLRTMGLGTQASLWEQLPSLRLPLLLLAGERDPKFSAIARDAAARCPNAEARVVPGCGHALLEEAPDAVADAIRAFLDRP